MTASKNVALVQGTAETLVGKHYQVHKFNPSFSFLTDIK